MKLIDNDKINTSYASQQFSNMIVKKNKNNDYRTFFLNGKWGSGKTTFLTEAEKNPNGYLKQNGWIVRYLKLWEIKDDRSVIELAFKTLFPKYYYSIWIIGLCCIVISLLLTPAFDIGLSCLLPYMFKIVLILIGLIVSVFQFFNLKSDYIFIQLLNFLFKNKKRKLVLVIDDFDRVDFEKQKEAYKLFNILHGYLPIVFVGEINNLIDADNQNISIRFLNKIIDQRVELPTIIKSSSVSKHYSKKLLNFVEESDPKYNDRFRTFLVREFETKNYTLRELEQFLDLLNDELIKKKGRIRICQQIIIVYLYLFYPEEYTTLIENYNFQKKRFKDLNKGVDFNKYYVSDILDDKDTRSIPCGFLDRPVSYFINDSIENLSTDAVEKILQEIVQEPTNFKNIDSYQFELINYIESKRFEKRELVNFAKKILSYIKDPELNVLIDSVIFTLKQNCLTEPLEFWYDITNSLNIPEKCYFFTKFDIIKTGIYKHFKKDILEYINSTAKIERPSSIAFFLIEGNPLKFKDYKSQLKKIFDIQDKDCEEHIYMFLIYLRVYDFESKKILTELLSVLGNPIDISDFANFMNEEFLNKLKLEEN